MNELHLFAGAGGGILGGILLGHTCVCAVEIEPYCRKVLFQRQRDGILPKFPIWDDVTTFDGKPWKGKVDVVCGGFPCQDISAAGRGAGIRGGERSGLWAHFARIISEVCPSLVWVENSPMLTLRGLDIVLGDLATMGYDAIWGVVSAENAGAPHERRRIWILAYTGEKRGSRVNGSEIDRCSDVVTWDQTSILQGNTSNPDSKGSQGQQLLVRTESPQSTTGSVCWWKTEPGMGRVADGVANRVDRLAAIGNGQVPAVVKLAWETLSI